MSAENIANGDIINFQLVQNGLVGDSRVESKVSGIVQYSTARLIDPQINQKHATLYPYFQNKVNNVNDPSVYEYLVLVGRNDETEVIGLPWVNDHTLTVVDGRIANLSIQNWREDFRAPLTSFLSSMGISYTLNVFDK